MNITTVHDHEQELPVLLYNVETSCLPLIAVEYCHLRLNDACFYEVVLSLH